MIEPRHEHLYTGNNYMHTLAKRVDIDEIYFIRFYTICHGKKSSEKEINRGYLLFWGEHQIYFIECVENIRIFMSAQHE